jgi:hypothetical protein
MATAFLRFRWPAFLIDVRVICSLASGGDHPSGTARKIRAGRRLESGWNPACHFFTGG